MINPILMILMNVCGWVLMIFMPQSFIMIMIILNIMWAFWIAISIEDINLKSQDKK